MAAIDPAAFPFDDTTDFADADRGLIAEGEAVIRDDRGEVIWDNGSYTGFIGGEAPDTVHPSLWRQSTLSAKQGLFEVTDGIYQPESAQRPGGCADAHRAGACPGRTGRRRRSRRALGGLGAERR